MREGMKVATLATPSLDLHRDVRVRLHRIRGQAATDCNAFIAAVIVCLQDQ